MDDIKSIETLGVFHGFPPLFSKRFSPILRHRKSETPKSLDVSWISATDIWPNIVEAQRQANNQQYSFPYCFLKLTAVNAIDSSDNMNFLARNLFRMGMPGKIDPASSSYLMHRFITADFEIEVTFITDDYDEVKRFDNKWKFVSVERRLNCNWVYDGITLSVRTELDGTLNYPEKVNGVEEVNFYEVKANLKIRGFMSESDPDGPEERVSTIKQVNLRVILQQDDFSDSFSVSSGLGNDSLFPSTPLSPDDYEEIIISVDEEGITTIQEGN